MEIGRRQLLGLLPALALAPRAALAQTGGDPAQAQLAPFWPLLQSLPSIHAAPRSGSAADVCYMFTNKSCAVCKLVDRKYAPGFRYLEMRYIVYPWPGDDYRELNYMYRPATTEAEFRSYMNRRLTARSPSSSPALAQQVIAAGAAIAHELVEGDMFGTPFFFYASGANSSGTKYFTAGDIAVLEPMLDQVA